MVRTPRKKIVIAALALLAVSAIAFAAQPIRDAVCFPFLSPTEKKIVGEWQASMLGGVSVTTIHADHRWTSAGGSCFGDGGLISPAAGDLTALTSFSRSLQASLETCQRLPPGVVLSSSL